MVDLIDAKINLNLEVDRDEIYWEQRAYANWLKLRDKITAFFHNFANQRKKRNTIRCLSTSDGMLVNDEESMGTVVIALGKTIDFSLLKL